MKTRLLLSFAIGSIVGAWVCHRFVKTAAPDCPVAVAPAPIAIAPAAPAPTERPPSRLVSPSERAASPPRETQAGIPDCPASMASEAHHPLPFSFTCVCGREAWKSGSVWGSEVYTSDSSICAAAKHAEGVEEGVVTVHLQPGLRAYPGAVKNGITSASYATWAKSFSFVASPDLRAANVESREVDRECPASAVAWRRSHPSVDSLVCECSASATASGSVWGTGTYTGDSSICRAAKHAGRWHRDGDEVRVYWREGQGRYDGSSARGVQTQSYGAFESSFTF